MGIIYAPTSGPGKWYYLCTYIWTGQVVLSMHLHLDRASGIIYAPTSGPGKWYYLCTYIWTEQVVLSMHLHLDRASGIFYVHFPLTMLKTM